MLSEAEVIRKLQGQGKVLSEREQEIARLQEQLAIAEGKKDELLAQRAEELSATKAELAKLRKAEQQRGEDLRKLLSERRNKLPEVVRGMVRDSLIEAAPDEAAAIVAQLEVQAATIAGRHVADGQPGSGGGDKSWAEELAEMNKQAEAMFFPKKEAK